MMQRGAIQPAPHLTHTGTSFYRCTATVEDLDPDPVSIPSLASSLLQYCNPWHDLYQITQLLATALNGSESRMTSPQNFQRMIPDVDQSPLS